MFNFHLVSRDIVKEAASILHMDSTFPFTKHLNI